MPSLMQRLMSHMLAGQGVLKPMIIPIRVGNQCPELSRGAGQEEHEPPQRALGMP
jgi:hypothetical protein